MPRLRLSITLDRLGVKNIMRSSVLVASAVLCVAAVGCKKESKTQLTSATSATPNAAPNKGADPTAKPEPEKEKEREKEKEKAQSHRHARAITVAYGQHPPKPEKESVPKIPELPELAKQEHGAAPPKLPVGEYACGASHSGDRDVPLMCLEDKNHEKEEKSARPLLSFRQLKVKLAPLPRVVDHREEETEVVRDQGAAGTCTTFGTAAAIDHAVTRWTGVPSHVSVMEMWGRYHQPDLGEALIASVGQTFASETAWPYDAKEAWPWRTCPRGGEKGKSECGKAVDRAKLAELEHKGEVIVEQVQWVPKDFEIMRHKIAAGDDPVIAIKLPRHFVPVGKEGTKYIPDYKEGVGGHALSIAGYAMGEKGDNYYLIHNSWGEKWGDGGYAWIHEATLAKHMFSGFGIVDARPLKGERAHREGKICPVGQAPDSHTGQCAAECKEGGPQHNGVCPELSDCGAGQVNLWGQCIGAAPTDKGKDEKSEISFNCGPGGCAYTLPKHIGKCSAEPCMISCPAPSFHVAKDEHGLTCIE